MIERKFAHIDRPVELPQEPFELFIGRLKQFMQTDVVLKEPSGMHLTVTETKSTLKLQDQEEAERLAATTPPVKYEQAPARLEVGIDPLRPISPFGKTGTYTKNWFGLQITKSDSLNKDKARAERYIAAKFDQEPWRLGVRTLNRSHITLGTLSDRARNEWQDLFSPENLQKNGVIVPAKLLLGGLRVVLYGLTQEL